MKLIHPYFVCQPPSLPPSLSVCCITHYIVREKINPQNKGYWCASTDMLFQWRFICSAIVISFSFASLYLPVTNKMWETLQKVLIDYSLHLLLITSHRLKLIWYICSLAVIYICLYCSHIEIAWCYHCVLILGQVTTPIIFVRITLKL